MSNAGMNHKEPAGDLDPWQNIRRGTLSDEGLRYEKLAGKILILIGNGKSIESIEHSIKSGSLRNR